MSELAIDVQHVGKRYADHVAVRDLTLQVPRGVVYGLLGPNGAGKTTTIRMILNIIAPDEGTIRVLGAPSTDPRASDRIGYLPEERGLYKKMNVRAVLQFLGVLRGMTRQAADRQVDFWARATLGSHAGQGLGTGKSRRALARYAAEGPVHRHAAARS